MFRVERDEKSNWATPYVWKNSKRTELVTPGTKRNRSYDLDGQLLWELGGMSSITIAMPYSQGRPALPQLGLRAGQGEADLRDSARAPRAISRLATTRPRATTSSPGATRRPGRTTPRTLLVRRLAVRALRSGLLRLLTIPRRARRSTRSSAFPRARRSPASPWAYGDKVFCLNEDGVTFVMQHRQGVRDPAHQHAGRRRHVHGHAGHGRRPAAAPHRGAAVLHSQKDAKPAG